MTRFGGLIRAWGAVIRHGAGLLRGIDMRLSAAVRHPFVRYYWRMWRWFWAMALLWLWFVIIAANVPAPRHGSNWYGPIWNYANATIGPVYDWINPSLSWVIWDPTNPSYTGDCTTFAKEYRTAGTPVLPPVWMGPNPVPECWDCHGAHVLVFGGYTGVAHEGGRPVLYR